ncbi:hypothetical protein BCR43DRAFT_487953 [Syncephalastrum racemosum]|uniref:Uncharacterized protein n=1 Tax=Syncephalastrum racemosum TaxID=13706 RepID=A0A1X2HHY8_SYNRA|nr:hypothetical protein BCR43DRAFT_487953 [Syncephalastrum racemosum]
MCLYTKNAWLSDLAVALFAAAIIAIQVAASATKVLATVSQNINNVFVTDILVLLDSINSYSWGEEHSAQKVCQLVCGTRTRTAFLKKKERKTIQETAVETSSWPI